MHEIWTISAWQVQLVVFMVYYVRYRTFIHGDFQNVLGIAIVLLKQLSFYCCLIWLQIQPFLMDARKLGSYCTNRWSQGFGSGSAWIRINLSCWIRIRFRIQNADPDPDPGGGEWPTKIEKSTEFSCFEVMDVLFWGLKTSPVAWASFMEA